MSLVESVKDHFPIINNSVSTPRSVLFSRKSIIDGTGIVKMYRTTCIDFSLLHYTKFKEGYSIVTTIEVCVSAPWTK
jgi:hypothetical protein